MSNNTRIFKGVSEEYLREIPDSWQIVSTKYIYNILLGKMLQNEAKSEKDREISYLKAANVQWEHIITDNMPTMWASPNEFNKFSVKNGDLLICEGGDVGRSGMLNDLKGDSIIQNAVHRVRSTKKAEAKYLMYVMRHISSTSWMDVLCNKATIAHFTSEKLGDLKLPLPSINEQKIIIEFLDKETFDIDQLIIKKQKLIRLLHEKRQALIDVAVTKGLNREVPMKDSAIEWLGAVPADWDVEKLKYVVATKITDGPHVTPQILDSGVPFVSAESVKGNIIDLNFKRGYISEEDHREFSKKCKPQRSDIFMVKSGSTTGAIGIVETDSEFSIWSPLALIRSKEHRHFQKFIFYSLQSTFFKEQVKTSWSFGTQQNIGMGVVENLFVLAPPLDQQNIIAQELDFQTNRIDVIVEKSMRSIVQLQEYRQSLISEAVTGKIDLRDYIKEVAE